MQRAKEAAELVGRNAAIWRMISGGRSSKVFTRDVEMSTRSASVWAGISDCSIGELARVVSAHSLGTGFKRRQRRPRSLSRRLRMGCKAQSPRVLRLRLMEAIRKYHKLGKTTFALSVTYVVDTVQA